MCKGNDNGDDDSEGDGGKYSDGEGFYKHGDGDMMVVMKTQVKTSNLGPTQFGETNPSISHCKTR